MSRLNLMIAMWDGYEEGRRERVSEVLADESFCDRERTLVLKKILPLLPEFRQRRDECGGKHDSLQQFEKLFHSALEADIEFPNTVDELVRYIRKKVDESY